MQQTLHKATNKQAGRIPQLHWASCPMNHTAKYQKEVFKLCLIAGNHSLCGGYSASLGFMSHSCSQIALTRTGEIVKCGFLPLFHWSARTSQKGGSAKKTWSNWWKVSESFVPNIIKRKSFLLSQNQVCLGKGMAMSTDAPSKFEWQACKYSWLYVPA